MLKFNFFGGKAYLVLEITRTNEHCETAGSVITGTKRVFIRDIDCTSERKDARILLSFAPFEVF